jgi:hypothetical protein
MSGSAIYVRCRVCKIYGSLYAGSAGVRNFENGSWDGEVVDAICDECENLEEQRISDLIVDEIFDEDLRKEGTNE